MLTSLSLEQEYFGTQIGTLQLFQLGHSKYYEKCKQVNSNELDSTGLRIYTGSHVLIRFLTSSFCKHLKLVSNNCNVVEIGCGSGAVGLVSCLYDLDWRKKIRNLLLTDGNSQAVQIAKLNVDHLFPNSQSQLNDFDSSFLSENIVNEINPNPTVNEFLPKIHCVQFLWSNSCHVSRSLCKHFNQNKPYDIVLGSELMYYRTDIRLLLSTVMNLIDRRKGLFIHAHVFRCELSQELLLKSILKSYDWVSITVPVHTFIEQDELNQHPEWYSVIVLISGHIDYINQLFFKSNSIIEQHQDNHVHEFVNKNIIKQSNFLKEFTTCKQALNENILE